jgi:hypothetical protein
MSTNRIALVMKVTTSQTKPPCSRVRAGRICGADDLVAHLRSEAGRHPYDRGLSDLVGQLSTRSTEFRTRWAAHNVRFHRTGTKRLHHPLVGDLDLSYETMELTADAA